jgi:enoyl-CoA hydratase/carnithine racemase
VNERKYKTLNWHKERFCIVVELNELPADEAAIALCATDMSELCEQIAWDEEIRVVVLLFSGNMQGSSNRISSGETVNVSLAEPVAGLKQPVIAAIRGDAIELGLELALACDIRIATEKAVFGMSQICSGGIPSNGGTQRLPRLIGQSRAMHMVLTGETIDAVDALRIGLVHRIVASEALLPSAIEMAREMAQKSPLSLSFVKEALYGSMDLTLDQGINKEMDLYLLLFSTSDRTEGINAFREKRKPEFKGI